MVWLVLGCFVDGLAGLWVVSSFTANEKQELLDIKISLVCGVKKMGCSIIYSISLGAVDLLLVKCRQG